MTAAPEPGYYVSAIDGDRHALMAGPFACRGLALDAVAATKDAAVDRLDLGMRATFAAWGTARVYGDDEVRPTQGTRRRFLPVFNPQPSECRFRVFARGSGHLRCVQAGAKEPGTGWVEIAKVNMPRKAARHDWYMSGFNGYREACEALYRIYRGQL